MYKNEFLIKQSISSIVYIFEQTLGQKPFDTY